MSEINNELFMFSDELFLCWVTFVMNMLFLSCFFCVRCHELVLSYSYFLLFLSSWLNDHFNWNWSLASGTPLSAASRPKSRLRWFWARVTCRTWHASSTTCISSESNTRPISTRYVTWLSSTFYKSWVHISNSGVSALLWEQQLK